MNRTKFITTALTAVAVVALVGYSMGIFGKSSSSISIKTDVQKIQVIPAITPRAKITPNYLTLSETQKHSTKEDCWVILDEHIYDITSYILQHPGGQKVILKVCGGEGSNVFNKVKQHRMQFVQEQMKVYLLGVVVK